MQHGKKSLPHVIDFLQIIVIIVNIDTLCTVKLHLLYTEYIIHLKSPYRLTVTRSLNLFSTAFYPISSSPYHYFLLSLQRFFCPTSTVYIFTNSFFPPYFPFSFFLFPNHYFPVFSYIPSYVDLVTTEDSSYNILLLKVDIKQCSHV